MTGRPITVLSIDGGGIRGVIPAMVLAEIEARTGKPITELFDLMAGSSTGGLLVMALATPDETGKPRFSAAELPNLYENHSRTIFSRTRWDAILAMDNWRVRRYPDTGMAEALYKLFGDTEVKDTLTDVLITSYDIERRSPWFFRSSRARQGEQCNFLVRDVVRATTAAPTFFEPARLPNSQDPNSPFSLIDGSMTSINPALCAYVEAREMYPDSDSFTVVSLGTGNLTAPLKHDEVRKWGLLNWARPLSDIMFDATSRTVDYQMKRLLPHAENGTERYFRLQKRIEGIDHRMDDISEPSLVMIREWGAELIADHDEKINQVCDILLEAWNAKQPQPQPEPEPETHPRGRFFDFRSLAFWRTKPDPAVENETETAEQVAQTG